MPHLKKRGRYWYVRYHFIEDGKDKTITKSLKTRYKERAQQMLRELKRREQLGEIDPKSETFNPADILKPEEDVELITVEKAVKEFLRSKSHLSPKTVEAYEWLLEHFMDFNAVRRFTPGELNKQHFENIIFKPDVSSSTRHNYFRHFRAWWNYLLDNEYVSKEFFDEIKTRLPKKKESTKQKMITPEELKSVFVTFGKELVRKTKLPDFDPKKVQYWFRPIICLYTFAGLRKHEAAYDSSLPYSGLKGENLIFKNGELSYIYLPPTKGRKEREIPLQPLLKKELQRYLKVRGEVKRKEYVFIYFGGRFKGRPVSGQTVYKEFKRYAHLAGVPPTRNLHGMRHRAVTSWIEDGFSTSEAAFLAGHSTQRVTEKYTHLTSRHLKKKMEEIYS